MKSRGEVWLLIKIFFDGRTSAEFFLIVSRDLRQLIFQKLASTKFFPGYATNSAKLTGLLEHLKTCHKLSKTIKEAKQVWF